MFWHGKYEAAWIKRQLEPGLGNCRYFFVMRGRAGSLKCWHNLRCDLLYAGYRRSMNDGCVRRGMFLRTGFGFKTKLNQNVYSWLKFLVSLWMIQCLLFWRKTMFGFMNLKLWNYFSIDVINPFPPTTSQIGSVSFLSIAYIAAIQDSILSENRPPNWPFETLFTDSFKSDFSRVLHWHVA